MSTALSALYVDAESGRTISTNSMLKTFLRCPKQAEYKYYRRLKPKTTGRPLTMGKWMHALLEAFYKGEDWKLVHHQLTHEYSKLFDEEKDMLGNLPVDCAVLMRAYIWHYRDHEWDILGVEQMLETEFPDGSIFRGKYDLLVKDEYGIWLVDHKNYKTMPRFDVLMLDTQAPRYIWAARRLGIPVRGFIWNILKTKPMTVPELTVKGERFKKTTMGNCDFPTAARAMKASGLDVEPYKPWLRGLKAQRYTHGGVQSSPFFQRVVIEMPDDQVDRVAVSSFHTSMRMHDYNFAVTDAVERVPDRSCGFMCSYPELCKTELLGGNTDLILRKQYKVADPMEYYYDERDADEKSEG